MAHTYGRREAVEKCGEQPRKPRGKRARQEGSQGRKGRTGKRLTRCIPLSHCNNNNSSNHDRGSSSWNGSDSRGDAASVTSTTGVLQQRRAGQQERVVLPSTEGFCSGAAVQTAISWQRVFTGTGFAALDRHSCCALSTSRVFSFRSSNGSEG